MSWFPLKKTVYILFFSFKCFDFYKTNKEISITRGEITYLFFQDFIMQTKFN